MRSLTFINIILKYFSIFYENVDIELEKLLLSTYLTSILDFDVVGIKSSWGAFRRCGSETIEHMSKFSQRREICIFRQ